MRRQKKVGKKFWKVRGGFNPFFFCDGQGCKEKNSFLGGREKGRERKKTEDNLSKNTLEKKRKNKCAELGPFLHLLNMPLDNFFYFLVFQES